MYLNGKITAFLYGTICAFWYFAKETLLHNETMTLSVIELYMSFLLPQNIYLVYINTYNK